MLYTKKGKRELSCGSIDFTSSSSKLLIHLYTHFVFRRKLGAIFDSLKVSGLRCMPCTDISVLWFPVWPLFLHLHLSALYFNGGAKSASCCMTPQNFKVFPERLFERSRENYLFVYVQFFLRPRIFTFLLCTAAIVYNCKTLLLLTVSVVYCIWLSKHVYVCMCVWVNISAAMT